MINNIIEAIDTTLKENMDKISAMEADHKAALKHAEEMADRITETQIECDRLRAAKDALAGKMPNLLQGITAEAVSAPARVGKIMADPNYYQAGKDNV